jgi:hypothetical protein
VKARAPLAVLAAAALTLSGCMAEMVEKRRPRKGPVAEVGYIETGGGEVRYSTEGWGLVVKMRRSSAFRRMRRLCKKDLQVKIADEFTRDDVDTPYSGMDIQDTVQRGHQHYNVAPHHHIVFDCVPKPAAPSAVADKSGGKTP